MILTFPVISKQKPIFNISPPALLKITASAVLYFGCSKNAGNVYNVANKPMMIANSAAPSTNAAARIMLARISLDASG